MTYNVFSGTLNPTQSIKSIMCWQQTVRMSWWFDAAVLGFDKIPLWGTFIISFGCGAISAVVIRMFVVPWQRRRIKGWSRVT